MDILNTIFGGHFALAVIAGGLWIGGGISFFRDATRLKRNNELDEPVNPLCTLVANIFILCASIGTLFAKEGLLFKQYPLEFSGVRILHHFAEKVCYGAITLSLAIHYMSNNTPFTIPALHAILATALYSGIMVWGSHADPMVAGDRYAAPEMAFHMYSIHAPVFVALMSALQAITKEKNPYRFLQSIGAQVAGVWYIIIGFVMGLDSWHMCFGWENATNPDSTYYNRNCETETQIIHATVATPVFGIVIGTVFLINLCLMTLYGHGIHCGGYIPVDTASRKHSIVDMELMHKQ